MLCHEAPALRKLVSEVQFQLEGQVQQVVASLLESAST